MTTSTQRCIFSLPVDLNSGSMEEDYEYSAMSCTTSIPVIDISGNTTTTIAGVSTTNGFFYGDIINSVFLFLILTFAVLNFMAFFLFGVLTKSRKNYKWLQILILLFLFLVLLFLRLGFYILLLERLLNFSINDYSEFNFWKLVVNNSFWFSFDDFWRNYFILYNICFYWKFFILRCKSPD